MKQLAAMTIVLLFVFLFNSGEVAHAQPTPKPLSATPKAFQVFYAKFRTAVIARDKTTDVSLTTFPFQYGYDAGDEGTYTKAQFLRRFDRIFGSQRAIFARRAPSFYDDEDWGFDLLDESDASHFIFEKKGASYQFTAYIVEP